MTLRAKFRWRSRVAFGPYFTNGLFRQFCSPVFSAFPRTGPGPASPTPFAHFVVHIVERSSSEQMGGIAANPIIASVAGVKIAERLT